MVAGMYLWVFSLVSREHVLERTVTPPDPAPANVGFASRHYGPIAVCVTGQPARLQPEHLALLLRANEGLRFDVFFHLANSSAAVFNTQPGAAHSTPYADLSPSEIIQRLEELIGPYARSVDVRWWVPRTANEWIRILKLTGEPLARIWQYRRGQATILNMYRHHEECARQIQGRYYSAVLSLREDTFLFRGIDLRAKLLPLLHQGCDVIARDCLSWGGLNMRMQALSSPALLLGRLECYRSLYESASPKYIKNPEQFEAYCARRQNLSTCLVSVEELPVSVMRYPAKGESLCFIPQEVDPKCVPKAYSAWTNKHLCPETEQTSSGLASRLSRLLIANTGNDTQQRLAA